MIKEHDEAIADESLGTQILTKHIMHRLRNGKNALICIVGSTGSGKSYAGLALMDVFNRLRDGVSQDPKMDVDNVLFKPKKVLEKINNPDLKKYVFVEWDEAGVGMSHKTYQTVANRVLSYLLQTFRNMQLVFVFTVPSMSFIDSSCRKLFHYLIEVRYIDKRNNTCILKPLQIQYNVRMDKIYYHKIKYVIKGRTYKVHNAGLKKPREEVIKLYENKKWKFTKELNLDIEAKLKEDEPDKIDAIQSRGLDPINEDLQHRIYHKYFANGIISSMKIAEIEGTSQPNISKAIRKLRNKGYSPKDFSLLTSHNHRTKKEGNFGSPINSKTGYKLVIPTTNDDE